MKIVVLYEELAWYFINCINTLAGQYNAQVLVVCKKPNTAAPFRFPFVHPNISIQLREACSEAELAALIRDFRPTGIFLAGWSNKMYLRIVKAHKEVTTAIGFDNHWTGSVKQRLGAVYFRLFLKARVKHAFVPGAQQREFARHLGFTEEHITEGAYCCDYDRFSAYYERYRDDKAKQFPKRFLFVGRYAPEKSVHELWQAFIEWQSVNPNAWELWCLGKGELSAPPHPGIRHFGFLQPDQLDEIIKNTGVFVLPSRFEPWGVVVHEFAAAGYPLLLSEQTGAAGTFLVDGRNGYRISGGNKRQLIEKMNKFSTLNEKELLAMANESVQFAARITPSVWAERFRKMFSL